MAFYYYILPVGCAIKQFFEFSQTYTYCVKPLNVPFIITHKLMFGVSGFCNKSIIMRWLTFMTSSSV